MIFLKFSKPFLIILLLLQLNIISNRAFSGGNDTSTNSIDVENEDEKDTSGGLSSKKLLKTIYRFSMNIFKTFPDPMKMNDTPFDVNMGFFFGKYKGIYRNMELAGYSGIQYNVSNLNINGLKMDFSAKFPIFVYTGDLYLSGWTWVIFPVNIKLKMNNNMFNIVTESKNGVGRFELGRSEFRATPELPFYIYFTMVIMTIFGVVINSIFWGIMFQKLIRKFTTLEKDRYKPKNPIIIDTLNLFEIKPMPAPASF